MDIEIVSHDSFCEPLYVLLVIIIICIYIYFGESRTCTTQHEQTGAQATLFQPPRETIPFDACARKSDTDSDFSSIARALILILYRGSRRGGGGVVKR